MKQGFNIDIEAKTLENEYFREVLFTSPHSQLVVMSLKPAEEIGLEIHQDHDQFIRVEAGEGVAFLGGDEIPLADGVAVVVPGGVEHNVINTSTDRTLKLYTIYTPSEHPPATIHKTKQEADAAELEHHH